jgi:hypothetical protein
MDEVELSFDETIREEDYSFEEEIQEKIDSCDESMDFVKLWIRIYVNQCRRANEFFSSKIEEVRTRCLTLLNNYKFKVRTHANKRMMRMILCG